jgi:hypothetical protein
MQLRADDGHARDPGGSPFACESSCARRANAALSELVASERRAGQPLRVVKRKGLGRPSAPCRSEQPGV